MPGAGSARPGRPASPAGRRQPAAAPAPSRAGAQPSVAAPASAGAPLGGRGVVAARRPRRRQPAAARAAAPAAASPQPARRRGRAGSFKDALLAEIRKSKAVFYNTVVAQAQKIEVAGDRVTFTFSPHAARAARQFEQNRAWLESLAQQVAGRQIAVAVGAGRRCGAARRPTPARRPPRQRPSKKSALREQALADAGVQAMLEVFPAEIRDVEEM